MADDVDTAPLQEWMGRQAAIRTLHGRFKQERQLRTIRRPLVSEGRFWFAAPEQFRWEVGDPPKMVAIKTGADELVVTEPQKGSVERFDLTVPERADAAQRLGLFQPGMMSSWPEFQETFRVSDLTRAGDLITAELRMQDARMALAVLRLEMIIDTRYDSVRAFEMFFRDGSSVKISFLDVVINAGIEPGRFTVDP